MSHLQNSRKQFKDSFIFAMQDLHVDTIYLFSTSKKYMQSLISVQLNMCMGVQISALAYAKIDKILYMYIDIKHCKANFALGGK